MPATQSQTNIDYEVIKKNFDFIDVNRIKMTSEKFFAHHTIEWLTCSPIDKSSGIALLR
jgi:hypothetical protein